MIDKEKQEARYRRKRAAQQKKHRELMKHTKGSVWKCPGCGGKFTGNQCFECRIERPK